MNISRRRLVAGIGAIGAVNAVRPKCARAAGTDPIRVGLLTTKTGPVASGGIDMERALMMYLKERDYVLSGRKVELTSVDTTSVPAIARVKTQELVEKNNVHCLVGPLA